MKNIENDYLCTNDYLCSIESYFLFHLISAKTPGRPKTPGRTPFTGQTPMRTPHHHQGSSHRPRTSPIPTPRERLFADMLPKPGRTPSNINTPVSKTISNTVQECMNPSTSSSQSASTVQHKDNVTTCPKPDSGSQGDNQGHRQQRHDQGSQNHTNTNSASHVSNGPSLAATEKGPCGDCGKAQTDSQSQNPIPEHSLNETFTFNGVLDAGVGQLKGSVKDPSSNVKNSQPTKHHKLSGKSDCQTTLSQTTSHSHKTPNTDTVSVHRETVVESRVDSGTITKTKPASMNITPPNHSSSVVRAMDFSNMPCPSPGE